MIINSQNLAALNTAFNASYQKGLAKVEPTWPTIATEVKSTSASNTYAWLGAWPRLREWIGDREVDNISAHDYTIKNRKFSGVVKVKADDIEDDQFGIYAPVFEEFGRSARVHPDELVYEAVRNGFVDLAYDKVPFFGDHKVGKKVVKNYQAGDKTPWYLLDCSRALLPFIYQNRRPYRLVRRDDPNKSDDVFDTDEFKYGIDCRANVGYGFWQMAFGSKAELTRENLRAAFADMGGQQDDKGNKLAVRATHLLVPPSLEFAARDLVVASVNAAGATNTDFNLVKVIASPYLG